jgi:hypothetical protein
VQQFVAYRVYDRKKTSVADFVLAEKRPADSVVHKYVRGQDDSPGRRQNRPVQHVVLVKEVAFREPKIVLDNVVEPQHFPPRRWHQLSQCREMQHRVECDSLR